ncbi:aspartate/glutamate racemase family protein [Paraburkholderia xenovorans]|uniref:aspartate/glutamate racemase family protein n=1 Tax=Paraburkholderia xenovorans TaxID=36873 RepID=UPI0038B99E3A
MRAPLPRNSGENARSFKLAGKTVRIVCLHTADSNIAIFDEAARAARFHSLELEHRVRADLLAAAEQVGGLTDAIAAQTREVVLALCRDANAVLLNCTTLGPVVDETLAARAAPVPVVRVDAALAQRAVENGGKVVVLYTVSTTREPTTRLFAEAASHAGVAVDLRVQLVERAWERFRAGDTAGYLSTIAAAAEAAYADGADVVALAQASMTGAAALVTRGDKPLTSPEAALAAVVRAASLAN